jgi:hypothetical protein
MNTTQHLGVENQRLRKQPLPLFVVLSSGLSRGASNACGVDQSVLLASLLPIVNDPDGNPKPAMSSAHRSIICRRVCVVDKLESVQTLSALAVEWFVWLGYVFTDTSTKQCSICIT